MKVGDTISISNAKGQIFKAILMQDVYTKNLAKHYGQKEDFFMDFIKVRRFIKSRGEFASTATEYPASSIEK